MTGTLTLDTIKKMLEQMNKPDALEEKGIPKDWVCVLHPRLEYALKDHYKLNDLPPNSMIGFLYNSVQHITGRKTFIISSAPQDKVEYMPELTMHIKYADYFISLAELRKMSEDESEIDDD